VIAAGPAAGLAQRLKANDGHPGPRGGGGRDPGRRLLLSGRHPSRLGHPRSRGGRTVWSAVQRCALRSLKQTRAWTQDADSAKLRSAGAQASTRASRRETQSWLWRRSARKSRQHARDRASWSRGSASRAADTVAVPGRPTSAAARSAARAWERGCSALCPPQGLRAPPWSGAGRQLAAALGLCCPWPCWRRSLPRQPARSRWSWSHGAMFAHAGCGRTGRWSQIGLRYLDSNPARGARSAWGDRESRCVAAHLLCSRVHNCARCLRWPASSYAPAWSRSF